MPRHCPVLQHGGKHFSLRGVLLQDKMTLMKDFSRYVILAVLLGTLASCDEPTRESDRAALDAQRKEILAFAASGQCTGNSECQYMGLGSKPCGGSWEFIVYSTSLDTQRLFAMVKEYDQNEDAYNRRWKIVSDCSMTPMPDSVGCLNGVCVKYRNGTPY